MGESIDRRRFVQLALGGLTLATAPGCFRNDLVCSFGPDRRADGNPKLEQTPRWARRSLFASVSPELGLVALDGGARLDGQAMLGRRWFIALIDWQSTDEGVDAGLCLMVMQKAQADLAAAGVSMVYAQVRHPQLSKRSKGPEPALAEFMAQSQLLESEGGPLPLPPAYVHESPKRAIPALERLVEPPNLLVIDEQGLVRWHSGGSLPDPSGAIELAMVWTIIQAIEYARDEL